MKIDVRVTQEGAANWIDDVVEMDGEPGDWTESDVRRLCDKMQYLIGGNNSTRTCERVGDGYRVAVSVEGRKVETMAPLSITSTVASSAVWNKVSR